MWRRWIGAICVLAVAGFTACGEVDDDPDREQTGMLMTVSSPVDTRVTHMKYEVYELDECAPVHERYQTGPPPHPERLIHESFKKLKKGLTLPGGLGKFDKAPLDPESKHRFADLMLTVDAGCYEVRVTPMRKTEDLKDKERVEECLPVQKSVEVEQGKLSEYVLISQCAGPDDGQGAMDIIAALNNSPVIVDYKQSQDVIECPDKGNPTLDKVCATALDPEKDPMNFVWTRAESDGTPNEGAVFFAEGEFTRMFPFEDAELLEEHIVMVDGHPTVQQCLKIEFMRPEEDMTVHFAVIVFDKLWDKLEGVKQPVTFEQWYHDRQITDDGQFILSRGVHSFSKKLKTCEDDAVPVIACNETMGYWMHRPNDARVVERWKTTGFEPFDVDDDENGASAQTLCPNERWIDILRNTGTWRGLYYRLARAFITARLNYAKFSWDHLPEMGIVLDALGEFLTDDDICKDEEGDDLAPGEKHIDEQLLDQVFDSDVIEAINEVADKLNAAHPGDLGDLQRLLNDVFNEHLCPWEVESFE